MRRLPFDRPTREQVCALAAKVGIDASLTQAAGGNVSWKEQGTIYVKASGTCLADALGSDIFVPLDLSESQLKIKNRQYDFAAGADRDLLRPSIETALHVVLPQKIILHLHPVDVIARTVQVGGIEGICDALTGLNWAWLDYVKPGEMLACEIERISAERDVPPDVWILANHGIVVCAESVDKVEGLLCDVMKRLVLRPRMLRGAPDLGKLDCWMRLGYRRPKDRRIDSLALDDTSLSIARKKWVLYPDHAVFLGATGYFVESDANLDQALPGGDRPIVVIVSNAGVLLSNGASSACEAMLSCYADVCLRLDDSDAVIGLNNAQIAELIVWDAEEYRRRMSR
jgi:rhamnose utilization protein RhaD (predicted bifunctional aldolase and dehydrogenase)